LIRDAMPDNPLWATKSGACALTAKAATLAATTGDSNLAQTLLALAESRVTPANPNATVTNRTSDLCTLAAAVIDITGDRARARQLLDASIYYYSRRV
ncbi:hypothetical protein ACFQ1S_02560, partial [Kibdelosporangium lantanae]